MMWNKGYRTARSEPSPHGRRPNGAPTGAFTLLELIIVVAVLAILAAIAIPNLLAAQTRAKVSRARADLKTIAGAIEAFRTDYGYYPGDRSVTLHAQLQGSVPGEKWKDERVGLTTPIAYLSDIPKDAFGPLRCDDEIEGCETTSYDIRTYFYTTKIYIERVGFPWNLDNDPMAPPKKLWVLQSKGPDVLFGNPAAAGEDEYEFPYTHAYDPTNGTVSSGNIVRSGP